MKIVPENIKVRCDMGACQNTAEYTVEFANMPKRRYMHICNECLTEMCALASRYLKPKSVSNVIKKSEEQRKAL